MPGLDLLIEIDRAGGERLHVQLESRLRDAIRAGRLPAGMRLPATRALAEQLGISRGVSVLRDALAHYLGRVRGTVADPERILVSSGHTQALVLVLRALRRQGVRRVALEDPGFVLHRLILAHLGLRAIPIPVDEHGIDTGLLGESDAEVAIVTPAHQFPTGVVLAPARRRALIDWAERNDALIVEDDYDADDPKMTILPAGMPRFLPDLAHASPGAPSLR